MNQAFRVKPHSSHELRYPENKPFIQSSFPFCNGKIKLQKRVDDQVEIKPYKSRAQMSRKKLMQIPLLKNLKFDSDKVSILKSAKNQYNLFMRKQQGRQSFNEKVLVVNGQGHTHRRTISNLQARRRGLGSTFEGYRSTSSLTFRGIRNSVDINLVPQISTLYISGKQKSFSPLRGESRSSANFGYQQLKI